MQLKRLRCLRGFELYRMTKPSAIFLMGPTASGKTELALELVRRLPCDIISVDSAMVYRGMDIGTAKPGPEVLAQAPHRLIDIRDPAEAYSAAQFCADAQREMPAITAAGRIPLLVGGTMLYYRALQQGLSDLPSANPALRFRLEEEARQQGWSALHARLAQVDPASAARIHPNDPQRIQRALEVYELTGTPLSELCARETAEGMHQSVLKLALVPADRVVLHERIGARFQHMLDLGLVEEVQTLFDRKDLHPGLPALRAVGYRQVWDYLGGEIPYQIMIDHAIIATRQLAKRQMTWLRREQNVTWFESEASALADKVMRRLEEGGLF